MKKLLFIFLLPLSSLIWSYDLNLTEEKIIIREYVEEEYYNNYDTKFTPGILIDSNIEEISILVNGQKFRSDKLFLNSVEPGNYHLKFNKGGYKATELWITYTEETFINIDVTLERERGYLNVTSDLEEYEIYLENQRLDIKNPLGTGSYHITIKSFGYEEQKSYVTIYRDTETIIEYNPAEVEFELQEININKEVINPLAKGSFDRLKLKISVNAPGKAILEYLDSSNTILKSEEIEFETWDTTITVNGYMDNNKLDNGIYRVRVKTDSKSLTTPYTVDDTLFISKIGLTLSDTAEYYNLGLSQTSFNIGRDFANSKTVISLDHIGNSYYGMGVSGSMDLTLLENSSSIALEAGLFRGFAPGLVAFKPNLGYRYNLDTLDNKTTYNHNLLFNVPVTVSPGKFGITLNPGLRYDFNGIFYTNGTVGLHWDNQKVKTGISGSMETEDYKELNFKYCGELNYLINNSQSYVGVSVIGDPDLNIQTNISISLLY